MDLDPQPRLAEHDLVARLQTQPFRAAGNRKTAAAANHARALRAAIVVEPIGIRRSVAFDVRMAPGDALVDFAGRFSKRHLIRSEQLGKKLDPAQINTILLDAYAVTDIMIRQHTNDSHGKPFGYAEEYFNEKLESDIVEMLLPDEITLPDEAKEKLITRKCRHHNR